MVSILLASASLGLSLSLGYHIVNELYFFVEEETVKKYEGALNLSLTLGVLLGQIGKYLEVTIISAKIFVILATTANFYLHTLTPIYTLKKHPIKNKASFTMIPFYVK